MPSMILLCHITLLYPLASFLHIDRESPKVIIKMADVVKPTSASEFILDETNEPKTP
jgi:hypothetical protein